MSYSTTSHLGDLGAALVDDQLDGPDREHVLVHLAGCDECRRDVEDQRRLKARLRAMAGPGLPPGLAIRLGALGERREDALVAPLPVALPAASTTLSSSERLPLGSHAVVRGVGSPRGRRLLVGAASLLLVGAGTAFAGGGDIQGSGPPAPTVGTVNSVHSVNTAVTSSTTGVSLNDPAFDAMTASFGR